MTRSAAIAPRWRVWIVLALLVYAHGGVVSGQSPNAAADQGPPAEPTVQGDTSPADADARATAHHAYHQQARTTIHEVLARDEFANLNPSDDQWLREKFEQIGEYFRRMRSGIDQLPVWVHKAIIAWMIITLLAILLHMIYTFWQSMGKNSRASEPDSSGSGDRPDPGLLGVRELNYDAVLRRAGEHHSAGNFELAIRHFYAAAILFLDRYGRVRFAPAKSNRDYLQELPMGDPAHPSLRMMTRQFEATVFGQRPVDHGAAQAMAQALDVIRSQILQADAPAATDNRTPQQESTP